MAQKKGHTGNPHGRPKGSPNKVTTSMRVWLSELIDGNRKQIEMDLKALDPKDRLAMLERFMQYTLPKMQSIEQDLTMTDLSTLSEAQIDAIVSRITAPIDKVVEYDDERSGGFLPLQKISPDKKVVLGLITTKTPTLEDKDKIIARIHEAAQYVPLDRLCLSPQCGFASCEIGNKLTEEEQWNKLKLVKEIVDEVWG